MAKSGKDQLAKRIEQLRIAFDLALSDKQKYPLTKFRAFVQCVRQYIELTADDPMIHKTVASSVNGLRESWKRTGNEFPVVFYLKQTDSSVWSSPAMTPPLAGTNRQVFDALH